MSAIAAISMDMPSGATSWAALNAAVLYDAARRLPDSAMTLRSGEAMFVVFLQAEVWQAEHISPPGR